MKSLKTLKNEIDRLIKNGVNPELEAVIPINGECRELLRIHELEVIRNKGDNVSTRVVSIEAQKEKDTIEIEQKDIKTLMKLNMKYIGAKVTFFEFKKNKLGQFCYMHPKLTGVISHVPNLSAFVVEVGNRLVHTSMSSVKFNKKEVK